MRLINYSSTCLSSVNNDSAQFPISCYVPIVPDSSPFRSGSFSFIVFIPHPFNVNTPTPLYLHCFNPSTQTHRNEHFKQPANGLGQPIGHELVSGCILYCSCRNNIKTSSLPRSPRSFPSLIFPLLDITFGRGYNIKNIPNIKFCIPREADSYLLFLQLWLLFDDFRWRHP